MELKMDLKPEKALEIREAILEELGNPSEDAWAGTVNVVEAEGVYEYTTGTESGHYSLSKDDVLIFIGYRNSFLSGTMLFQIEEKDVLNWEMLESQQPGRNPWNVGILNLTQHDCSKDQFKEGVKELLPSEKDELKKLLTFTTLPSKEEMVQRATKIAEIAHYAGYPKVMIGGAPYLMSALERELKKQDITPIYAFSQRVSEEKEINGEVVKIQVFKHLGFVEVSE